MRAKQDLLEIIRPLKNEPGIYSVIELLLVNIDDLKESLSVAKGDDILKIQGAIREIRNIVHDIQREMPTKEYKNGAYNL